MTTFSCYDDDANSAKLSCDHDNVTMLSCYYITVINNNKSSNLNFRLEKVQFSSSLHSQT
jgi:hypothetical protein